MSDAQNKVLLSDAYDFMLGIERDSVDLIATDPPYNTGRDFREFDDAWTDAKVDFMHHYTNLGGPARAVVDTARLLKGESMSAYLCYMGAVFQASRRALNPAGNIYVHCDDSSVHYLKLMLDAVFGPSQFLNDLVWKRSEGMNYARRFIRVTDNILFYCRERGSHYFDLDSTVSPLPSESLEVKFPLRDGRGRYTLRVPIAPSSPHAPTGDRTRKWRHYDPAADGYQWAVPYTGSIAQWFESQIPGFMSEPDFARRLDMLDGADMLYHPRAGKILKYKYYEDAFQGVPARNLITTIKGFNIFNARSAGFIGYPTQKPVELYELLISAASPAGGMVIDPFAGSGTTALAAKRLGRRFAGCDVNPVAVELANRRLSETLL